MEDYGILSILPPILAIVLAVKTKNLLVSLFLAGYAGVLTIYKGNIILALFNYIKDFVYVQASQSGNASSLCALLFIGSFVALLTKSGGSTALANKVVHLLNTRCKAQLAVWLAGLIIFFTDSGNSLIVGPAFQPVTDKLRVSREKLSYILDCTTSPICILIPFISWGIYIMGLMQKEFETLQLPLSEYEVFLSVIPFQYYAIATLLMVPIVAVTGYEFGSMFRAEKRTIDTGVPYDPKTSPAAAERKDEGFANELSSTAMAIIPLAVLFVCLFGLLIWHGFPFKNIPGNILRASLSVGYFLGSISCICLMVKKKMFSGEQCFNIFLEGQKDMIFIIVMLLLSWSLGAICKQLGTAMYIVKLMHGTIPSWVVAPLVFAVGAAISFTTGSSWGTFAILMPICIPLAHHIGAPMYATIGAVLSGGLFGDHCSPISDTTILASMGGACDHFDHVRTQLPYAIIVALASLIGYFIVGICDSKFVLIAPVLLTLIFTICLGRAFGAKLPRKIEI